MLQALGEILTSEEIIDYGIPTVFDAVCMETGARLSYGRSTWTLILPDQKPSRKEDFFHWSPWTYRVQFKAPTLEAAIRIGNEKLPRMLQKRDKA